MIVVAAAQENGGIGADAPLAGDFDTWLAGEQVVQGRARAGGADFLSINDRDIGKYLAGALGLAAGRDYDGI